MSEMKARMQAGFTLLHALAETIRFLGEVPSGEVYARLSGRITLGDYNQAISILKRTGLVTETRSHLLRWNKDAEMGKGATR
jgi:hypothetical protein